MGKEKKMRGVRAKRVVCLVWFVVFAAWSCRKAEVGQKGSIVLEEVVGTPTEGKRRGRVLAVLVGINQYKDKRFRSLQYAEKDARDMAAYLRSVGVGKQDIKLLVGSSATMVGVKAAVGKWLRQRAGREDAVFVFVSTHGEKLESGNFLVMYDSDAANLEYSGLSGGFLEGALKRMRVRQQMLVLDTCFSRAVASEYVASLEKKKSNFLPNTHGTMFRGKHRVVFTSSDGAEVSLEPKELGNGLYTYYFLKGLRGAADKDGDKCITAQEVQDYVSDKVSDEARKLGKTQTPSWKADSTGKGMLLVRMPGCGQRVASVSGTPSSGGTTSETTPSGGGWGILQVSANVGGVKVYVDGAYKAYLRGVGQTKRIRLRSGRHEVVLKKQGYKETREVVDLDSGADLPLEGVLAKLEQVAMVERPAARSMVAERPAARPMVVERPAARPMVVERPVVPPTTAARPAAPPTIAAVQNSQNQTPKAGDRKTFTVKGAEFAMRWIPSGTFAMGSPSEEVERGSDEGLQRRVRISKGFWMLESEVTQGQYKALMGSNPSRFKDCGDSCPVERVSWEEARAFANKLSQAEGLTACTDTDSEIFKCRGWRLPTEAEWEYAARAGTTTAFATGDCISTDEANYDGNNPQKGCPKGENREKAIGVCGLAKNAWGLCDMHGNVWEWTMDGYKDSYAGLSTQDPLRSSDTTKRVVRGGSWYNGARYVRSAGCFHLAPTYRNDNVGFRLLRY